MKKLFKAIKQALGRCSVCSEIHSILDADGSKIIRNTKDGYPEGREPRELTLAERVTALCVYAADWKRWCTEAEDRKQATETLYNELLFAVGNKYPGETRHRTALRYIRKAELPTGEAAKSSYDNT